MLYCVYVTQQFFHFAAKYWHGLYIDYKDVAIDVVKDCRERPVRATIYTTCMYHSFCVFVEFIIDITLRYNMYN